MTLYSKLKLKLSVFEIPELSRSMILECIACYGFSDDKKLLNVIKHLTKQGRSLESWKIRAVISALKNTKDSEVLITEMMSIVECLDDNEVKEALLKIETVCALEQLKAIDKEILRTIYKEMQEVQDISTQNNTISSEPYISLKLGD